MWQRWNGTSHVFEKSDDNGSSWAPLPLSAVTITEGILADARLSSNIPRLASSNVFAFGQSIAGNDPANAFLNIKNSLSTSPAGYSITAGIRNVSQDGFTIFNVGTNTTIFNLSSIGVLTLPNRFISTGINTLSGSVSSPHASVATLFQVDGTDQVSLYLVRAGIGTSSSDAANYGAFAIIAVEGTSARIVQFNTSTVTITLSGLYVLASQSSGATSNIKWVALKIV